MYRDLQRRRGMLATALWLFAVTAWLICGVLAVILFGRVNGDHLVVALYVAAGAVSAIAALALALTK